VAMTTRQLATLIGAGFPLVSALDALLPQTHSHALKRTLARVKDLVVEGNSFAYALAQFPAISRRSTSTWCAPERPREPWKSCSNGC